MKINQKGFAPILIILLVLLVGAVGYFAYVKKEPAGQQPTAIPSTTSVIEYKNTQYGFSFALPTTWKGYSIEMSQWEGTETIRGEVTIEDGPMVSIRHPQWTVQHPRQDISIMVFTVGQWNALQQDTFTTGWGVPSELGRNSKYVFALPGRSANCDPKDKSCENCDPIHDESCVTPTGYKEIEPILQGKTLKTFE